MFRVTFGVTIYFQLLLSRFQQYLMQLKSLFEGWAIARNDRAARVWIVKIREIYGTRKILRAWKTFEGGNGGILAWKRFEPRIRFVEASIRSEQTTWHANCKVAAKRGSSRERY